LTHSVNHWIRVEAFAMLHEGEFTAKEVADGIGEDVKYVSGHINDLYKSGCIERAGRKMVGGRLTTVYRGVLMPSVDTQEFMEMSVEDRHDLCGAVIQSLQAESVSSYRNGKMDSDGNLCLMWQPMQLDAKGREELLERQTSFWKDAQGIEGRSLRRMDRSGERGKFSILALLGFERGREGEPLGRYRCRHSRK
jgi:predicted transcriptional regulator